MTQKKASTLPESLDKSGTPPPRPSRKRQGSVTLTKIHHVRVEMSAVYREARRGKIDIKDLNGFINALAAIGRLIESSDLEKRLDELERRSTYGEI